MRCGGGAHESKDGAPHTPRRARRVKCDIMIWILQKWLIRVTHSLNSKAVLVLPPSSERLYHISIRTMAQCMPLGALLGCGCRVYE